MYVLSGRILLRPGDLDHSRRFYRDVLGLAVYRASMAYHPVIVQSTRSGADSGAC